jgi:bacterioferritin
MKGDPAVIATLNELLAVELTAVHQYMLHARMCEDWGYERLYQKIHEESREELEHADHLVERILYLDGSPDVARVGTITPGASVEEQFRADLGIESGAISALNRAIEQSRRAGDNGTAELLEEILEDTEEHAHWLESQLFVIGQIGAAQYLAEQVKGGSGS